MYSVATYRLSTGNKAEELSSKAFFLDNNEKSSVRIASCHPT